MSKPVGWPKRILRVLARVSTSYFVVGVLALLVAFVTGSVWYFVFSAGWFMCAFLWFIREHRTSPPSEH